MKDRRQENRRAHPRVEFNWPAILLNDQGRIQGKIKDISRGGALVLVNSRVELGESVKMVVELTEFDDVITAKGLIVRVVSLSDDDDVPLYGLGVQFTEISEQDLRYFTGNLAPEWQEGYERNEKQVNEGYDFSKIMSSSTILLLVAVLAFLLIIRDNGRNRNRFPAVVQTIPQAGQTVPGSSGDIQKIRSLERQLRLMEEKIQELRAGKVTEANNQTVNKSVQKSPVERKSVENKPLVSKPAISTPPVIQTVVPEIERTDEEVIIQAGKKKKLAGGDKAALSVTISDLRTVTGYHLVLPGEDIHDVSTKFAMTIDQLRHLNNLPPGTKIQPYQKLLVILPAPGN